MSLESDLDTAALKFKCERLERELAEAMTLNTDLFDEMRKRGSEIGKWREEVCDLRVKWNAAQAKLSRIPRWIRAFFRAV